MGHFQGNLFCFHNHQLKLLNNPCGAGGQLLWENHANTVAADALAPYIARSSSAMMLSI